MNKGKKDPQEDPPSKILKYLYLGGKQHAKMRSMLDSLKISYVLNCTPPRRYDNVLSFLDLDVISIFNLSLVLIQKLVVLISLKKIVKSHTNASQSSIIKVRIFLVIWKLHLILLNMLSIMDIF
jgi:hypothetical protein